LREEDPEAATWMPRTWTADSSDRSFPHLWSFDLMNINFGRKLFV
jgi:hypothetical protein